MTSPLGELLHRGDPAELVAEVDRLVNRQDWDTVLVVRDRCNEAAEMTGKQLWGVAQYAEYRLALEAPGDIAASVVTPGGARFALGPLTEVIATRHTWDEVADEFDVPIVAATVAQERVLRGEDLRGDDRAWPEELELPLVLADWEPRYALPVYREDELLQDGPPVPDVPARPVSAAPAPPADDEDLERAAFDLVRPWVEESNGWCHIAVVRGDAEGAVAALVPGEARVTALTLDEALARLVWVASSGGVHGRRRGGAAGRSAAFWFLQVLTGLGYGADPDALGDALADVSWLLFDEGSEETGWRLRLAAAFGDQALAIDAGDDPEDDDPLA